MDNVQVSGVGGLNLVSGSSAHWVGGHRGSCALSKRSDFTGSLRPKKRKVKKWCSLHTGKCTSVIYCGRLPRRPAAALAAGSRAGWIRCDLVTASSLQLSTSVAG
eukprot:3627149-Rhodomonas_salina.3